MGRARSTASTWRSPPARCIDPTKLARTYSKGNRQKVVLVAALASDAELLILDEPTSGLDPSMEAVFQEYIREDAPGADRVVDDPRPAWDSER